MQDWTENSIKRAFLILDEPGHGQQYLNDGGFYPDDYPEGSPEGLQIEKLTEEFKTKQIEMTIFQLQETLYKTLDIMKRIYPSIDVNDWSNEEELANLDLKFR